MKLTRRGILVVGAALLAFMLGANFGARALDVIVVPTIAVLAIAVVQVALTDRPTVERSVPDPGFPGDERTMRLRFETDGIVSFTDHLGKEQGTEREQELRPTTVDRTVTGNQTIEYDVELVGRGVHNVGPLSVDVRDSLGLITTQHQYTDFEPLFVYPRIHQLTSPKLLAAITRLDEQIERQEFDELREYVPGDSLRDVHWKRSAKHQDDLFVVGYTHSGGEGVSIVAEATADRGGDSVDAMASATASVVTHLLDHGVDVSLAAPNGHLEEERTEYRRDAMLGLLARTRPGRVSTEHVESADMYILGERGRATIEIDGQQFSFEELSGNRTGSGIDDRTQNEKRERNEEASGRGIPA